ncbi:hypothetical protein ScalyP_jg958 [Parmales sp. scaly parma]|nr:hypothetical protein ScalyP_jg958 [Parmales sp. scaly parma]
MGERIHRHQQQAKADPWENGSNASLGTAAAFHNTIGIGTLFSKDGEYNTEFLQTFVTKPLKIKNPPPKPIRNPVLFASGPKGFDSRTIIYFKNSSLETDSQQREKFHLLTKAEQSHQAALALSKKAEVFQEKRRLRKAWNTPKELPGALPKPPPRVSVEERKARKAKAEAELENHGALVETVMVPDPSFGAGKHGTRLQIQACPPPNSCSRPYNPQSYTPTTSSPNRSQFGDGDDDLQQYFRPPPPPLYENASPHELRLLTAARTKQIEADNVKRKLQILEKFVGGLKGSIKSLNTPAKDKDKEEDDVDPNKEFFSLGENTLLGTSGGELAAAINQLRVDQLKQTKMIEKLGNEKKLAEKQVRKLEKEILNSRKYPGAVVTSEKIETSTAAEKTNAFLKRQANHEKNRNEKIASKKEEEAAELDKFKQFKAKTLVPGRMAANAEIMIEDDVQKVKEREVNNQLRQTEMEFSGGGPSMLAKEAAGVTTTAQLRGNERREKERSELEAAANNS